MGSAKKIFSKLNRGKGATVTEIDDKTKLGDKLIRKWLDILEAYKYVRRRLRTKDDLPRLGKKKKKEKGRRPHEYYLTEKGIKRYNFLLSVPEEWEVPEHLLLSPDVRSLSDLRELGDKLGRVKAMDELRRAHTEDLKREVIRPWIDQLPYVGFDKIYYSLEGSLHIYFRHDTKLEVEEEFFDDFRNHVCFTPNPLKLWGSFRKKVKKFWELREGVSREAKEWIEEKIGMEVDPQLAKWAVKACKMALEDEETFKRQFVNFSSRVEPSAKRGEDKLVYWVSTYMGPQMSSKKTDKESFKKMVDARIQEAIGEIRTTKFSGKVERLVRVVQELEALRDRIERVLEKYLRRVIFPGDCDYL